MDTLSLTKEARIYNGLKTISNKSCWENWSTTCKRMKLDHFLIPHTKINSKWIRGSFQLQVIKGQSYLKGKIVGYFKYVMAQFYTCVLTG